MELEFLRYFYNTAKYYMGSDNLDIYYNDIKRSFNKPLPDGYELKEIKITPGYTEYNFDYE